MSIPRYLLSACLLAALCMPIAGQDKPAPAVAASASDASNVTASLPPPVALPQDGATSAPAESSASLSNLSRPDFIKAVYVDSLGPALKSADGIKKLVADCKNAGFNTIIAQVRTNGDAMYKSGIVPRAKGLAEGFDPLKVLIDEAHGQTPKIDVHGMLVVFRVWTKVGGEMPDNNVGKQHPEWLTQASDGRKEVGDSKNEYWLDPAVPGAQDHLAAVCAELAKDYEIDGIHLDRVRYPERRLAGYNPEAVDRYLKEKGKTEKPSPEDEDWVGWRRAQVNESVRKMRDAAKGARPSVVVSGSAITFGGGPQGLAEYRKYSTAYAQMLGDWIGWGEEGLVDVNIVANYKAADKDALAFERWCNLGLSNKGKSKVVIAVGGWLNPPKYTLAMMLQGVLDPRCDGVALYSYHQPAKPPATSQQAMAAVKQVFDQALVESKAKDIAEVSKEAGLDPMRRLDKLSVKVTGIVETPVPVRTATVARAPVRTPAPTPRPQVNLPSLSRATGPTSNLPSIASVVGGPAKPNLPSLGSASGAGSTASSPSGLTGLSAVIKSSGASGAPIQAAPSGGLPNLSAASGSQPPTGMPALGATASSLPGLSAAVSPPGSASSLPALGSSSAPSGMPGLDAATAPPTAATPSGPLKITDLPGFAPTPSTEERKTLFPGFHGTTASSTDAAAGESGSISIPGSGPQTNYTGAPVAGATPIAPQITPPTLKDKPADGVAGMAALPSGAASAPAAGSAKNYAPRSYRRSGNPTAVASATAFETITMKNGKEFTGRVLERGSIWKIQLLDGSIISLAENRIANVRAAQPQ